MAVTKDFSIYHDLNIKAPAREVFEKITLPDHLINWWPLRCEGEPEVGASYNFYFTPEFDWYGKVIACNPNVAFQIKMTQADADWKGTSFSFDLEDTAKGVLLKFSHKSWPKCNHHFRRSSFCWAILLNSLKKYIEKGTVVPFEERQ
ncbi:SRPBCC domain-containing protein [Pricia sp. S334]|uniref:SRPBCC domain-containing protein n=1 Tax=Pricia mediterranea TaxID=3076079 RepID=A0ABU3L075_9FLAO|nr:SRPBCC domain-containing protein [Pricia sp. S334]MDT7827134.1 SRPBCC domain-containing protein [Pricia sp. S334]